MKSEARAEITETKVMAVEVMLAIERDYEVIRKDKACGHVIEIYRFYKVYY